MRILIDFERKPLLFENPVSIIRCDEPSKLRKSFEDIENFLDSGLYIAGFMSYEAGHCFEEKLFEARRFDFPLLMFAAYDRPKFERPGKIQRSFKLDDLRLNISKEKYSSNIERIRRHISIGDVYQITYCIKYHFNFKGDALSLHQKLYEIQPVPYSAYIEADDFRILSLSPERFIRKRGTDILTEPMKGTWWRGRNWIEDLVERFKFGKDTKNRAENIMIADLLRNDMGRIGTDIDWPKVYTITKYRTLFQMTSTVTAKVRRNIKVYDLFAALFPSGSVTGAPKIRAMELIKGIEKEERRIYTGAIGYITPERDMYFNIPIRTVLIKDNKAEMGIGGGIVWDSTSDGEWDEGMLKARFLTALASK